jgi:hypothetical protein
MWFTGRSILQAYAPGHKNEACNSAPVPCVGDDARTIIREMALDSRRFCEWWGGQNNLRSVYLLVSVALVVFLSISTRSQSKQRKPFHNFSTDATYLIDYDRDGSLKVVSPDGKKSILVYHKDRTDYYELRVRVHAYGKSFWTGIGDHVGPEVMWAPDSEAFAETFSDAGAVGTFHVLVYYVEENGLKIIEPTKSVSREFLSHPRECFDPEDPNIGGIMWIGDSSELLVAAETLPHSNCENMGTFRAYDIKLPQGQILKSYGQLEAKRVFWSHLGEELRNADDESIRDPKS